MTTTTSNTTTTGAPVTVESPPETPERPPRATRSFAIWLGGIAGLGLVIRCLNVLWWRETTDRVGFTGYRPWGDAWYYHHQANALAKGFFYIDPVAWHFFG